MNVKAIFFLAICLTILSCNDKSNKTKDTLAEILNPDNIFSVKGQWYSPGSAALPSTWYQFDDIEYFTWLHNEPKPTVASGTYVLENMTLECSKAERQELIYLRIDMITMDQIQLTQYGMGGNGLIFQRQTKK